MTVCDAEKEVLGQLLGCTETAGHHGPHSAPGEQPVVAAAWCTPPQPCRGGTCQGPCHADAPPTANQEPRP